MTIMTCCHARDCFECELLPVFSRVGAIYEHRLMMEQNGLNRGYAYVKFTNVQVSRVVVRLTQLVIWLVLFLI